LEEIQIIKTMAQLPPQWPKSLRFSSRVKSHQQELIQLAAENAADTLAALQAQWQS